jgi:hypothetical protein
MRKLAREKEGKCLSTKYINSSTKLKWSEGHSWEASPASVKYGSWCKICGYKKVASKKRATIDDMKNIAHERGGKCLSDTYINSRNKLHWICSDGHVWLV